MKYHLSKLLIVILFSFLETWSPIHLAAQTVTYPKVFTVAQDGSGDFKTIQEAVNAVRDLSQQQVIIHIKKGIYHEKLVIPSWKTKVYLLGENKDNTIITNADYSGKAYPGGKDAFGRDKFSTYTSYTVLVQGNDFKAENLTIENTSGRVGQAVALHVDMGSHILPAGWNNWGNPENEKTVLYAEYANKGEGANLNGRAKWSKQLTADEAKNYTLANILRGLDNWDPLKKMP